MAVETNWLDAFRGQHITAVTLAGNEEKSDTGTLMCVADGWIQLVKDNGEMILIPSTAIRIIKLLDMAHRTLAMDRAVELDSNSREYVTSDTQLRTHAPDDRAVM